MASETIYETNDLPESDQTQRSTPEQFQNENVESVQLDVGAAFLRFKGSDVPSQNIDLTQSTTTLRRRPGYRVIELLGTDDQPESVQEKFNRIRQEIIELSDQVNKIKDGTKQASATDTKLDTTELAGLQSGLKQVQVEKVLGEATVLNPSDPSLIQLADFKEKLSQATSDPQNKASKESHYELNKANVASSEEDTSKKMATLEARLAKLENFVGGDHAKLVRSGYGIDVHEAVDDLNEKGRSLIETNNLDSLDTRMTILAQKLERYNTARTKSSNSVDSSVLHEVQTKMNHWEELSSTLPDLVLRMQDLQALHHQALHFGQSLTMLEEVQEKLVKDLQSDKKLLNETQTEMAANMETIQKACAEIEIKSKKLSKK